MKLKHFFFLFFGCTCSIWMFPGQGSNSLQLQQRWILNPLHRGLNWCSTEISWIISPLYHSGNSFFFFFFFRAAPTAYGSSQARGQIRATATGLHHSLSRAYTTAHGNVRSLSHRGRPGIEPTSSWILVRFVYR